jgi:hypothetical protein
VFQGDERLGATPGEFTLPRGTAAVELTLKKKGYADKKLTVTPDRDREFDVELTRRGSSSSSHAAPKPAARPEVKPAPEAKPEPKPAGKLRDLKDPFSSPGN